jgi:hypothetical protein
MIVFQLGCDEDHFFEGWFASADAYEKQAQAGQLQCPTCASFEIRKLPSAPHVHTSGGGSTPVDSPGEAAVRIAAVKALRTFILANTENVGRKFAEVARRMHYQEEEARGIRGQVTPDEAAELQEEGVNTLSVSPEIIPSEEVH